MKTPGLRDGQFSRPLVSARLRRGDTYYWMQANPTQPFSIGSYTWNPLRVSILYQNFYFGLLKLV